jgi:4-hydroxybenzoate polyprenyltransferase
MGWIRNFAHKLWTFLEMIKWEHSIFALPFAYLGLFLAENGWPRPRLFWLVTLAMISFRTMAMAANRLIDAAIDARNPRTQNRALPAGRLKKTFVWFAALASFLTFEWSAAELGRLCLYLSPVPVIMAWFYPWAKRFTWLSHLLLGMILGVAPYGAWLASRGTWSLVPFFLSVGVTTWVAGFDMIYALQDISFDRQFGLYSFPAIFGEAATMAVTRCLHVLSAAMWAIAGWMAGLGWIYAAGMSLIVFFLVRQHWLILSFGLKKVEEAFFTMNAIVSLVVLVAAVADLSLR